MAEHDSVDSLASVSGSDTRHDWYPDHDALCATCRLPDGECVSSPAARRAQRSSDRHAQPTTLNPADELAKLAEASGDPAAFRLVYSTLMSTYDSSIRVGHMTTFADEVAALAVSALRSSGRLVPEGADTRTEYGVRLTWDDGTVTEDVCERAVAEGRVRFHAERRAAVPGWRVVSAEVVQREVTTAVGHWLPAPAAPEVAP